MPWEVKAKWLESTHKFLTGVITAHSNCVFTRRNGKEAKEELCLTCSWTIIELQNGEFNSLEFQLL